jgi:hydroxylamine dehydrogenase
MAIALCASAAAVWHHEGRRTRHGVSMMGPDYTHWHGTYEVAKHFYSKYVPELQELAEKHHDSKDPAKKEAAAKLRKLLDDTLNNANHQWYLNRMDPAEKARRDQERTEFQKRYAK